MNRKLISSNSAYTNFFLACVSTLLVLLVSISLKLRPISDDYCAGSVVTAHGLIGGVAHVYRVWSGDVFSLLITYGLVGIPLRFLDFQIASAIPFILAFFPFAILFYIKFGGREKTTSKSKFRMKLASTIWLYLSWYVALWTFNLTPGIDASVPVQPEFMWGMSLSTTYFQNINTGYVLTPGIIILLAYLLFYASHPMARYQVNFLGLLFGLIIGTSGAWIVVTYLVVQISSLIFRKLRKIQVRHVVAELLSMATSILGLFISISSPGTKNRRGALTSTAMENPDLAKLLSWTMGGAFQNLWVMFFSSATFLVILMGVVNGVILSGSIAKPDQKSANTLGFTLLAIGVSSTFVVRASEAFAYPAYWHFVGSMAFILFGIHVLSMSIAIKFISSPKWLGILLLSTTILIVLLTFSSSHKQIDARLAKWNMGPAPISGFADIEAKNGYVDLCWNIIKEERVTPERQIS
jgi:hypothetical protein